MPELTVIEVHAQQLIKSLHREVILDALCVVEDGSYANIEMQKSSGNDDIARTRFHASAITAQRTPRVLHSKMCQMSRFYISRR